MIGFSRLVAFLLNRLYKLLVRRPSQGFITRTGLILLNMWEAYIYISYGIGFEGFVDMGLSQHIKGSIIMTIAVISIAAFITKNMALTLVTLFISVIEFMYLTIGALSQRSTWAVAGLYMFITFVSTTAFWKAVLYSKRQSVGDMS